MSAPTTLAHRTRACLADPSLPLSGALWTALRRLWITVTTRNQLARLDDRMLRDLGLSRADVAREVARAPWDIAPTRRGDRGV